MSKNALSPLNTGIKSYKVYSKTLHYYEQKHPPPSLQQVQMLHDGGARDRR